MTKKVKWSIIRIQKDLNVSLDEVSKRKKIYLEISADKFEKMSYYYK